MAAAVTAGQKHSDRTAFAAGRFATGPVVAGDGRIGAAGEPEPSSQERILAAAREIFARKGYQQTSIARIAKAAGVARATVYNNFTDKLEILYVLVRRYMHGYVEIGQRLMDRVDGSETVFEHLESMLREGLQWRAANADLIPTVEMAKLIRGSGWRQAADASDQVWLEWMLVICEASQRMALVREDLDVDLAVRTTFSMIDSTLSKVDVGSDKAELERITHQVALLQWYAIFSIPPGQSPPISGILSNRRIMRQVAKARRLAASL